MIIVTQIIHSNNLFVTLCYILNSFGFTIVNCYIPNYTCITWVKTCMKFSCIKDHNYHDYCPSFVVISIINIHTVFCCFFLVFVFVFFFYTGNEIYTANMSDLNPPGTKSLLLNA